MNDEQKNHVTESLNQNIRFDGRQKDQYREVSVELGASETAEGSARVKIGETEVVAGVKLSIGTPYPDSPDEGTLMVNAEFLPMSNREFESGPPGMDAIELARVVDRGIRESHSIDTHKLCIEKGEKIWMVSIDIVTINAAGNLLDAAGIAALAALKDAKFPKYENDEIDYHTKTDEGIPLEKDPLPITVHKLGENLFVDPLIEEEKASEARLTIAVTADGQLCAMQKGEDMPLSVDEIDEMVGLALAKAEEIRKVM